MRIKSAKIICIVALILSVLYLACVGVYTWIVPSYDHAETSFEVDYNLLNTVVAYFENRSENEYIHRNVRYYDEIDDEDVVDAIDNLFDRQYQAVGRTGNTIYFIKWIRTNGSNVGIAYTISAKEQPTVDRIVKFEKLSRDKWYYFETE